MPRVSMAQAADKMANLQPFQTSGALIGEWFTPTQYRVRSYGATIASVSVMPTGKGAEHRLAVELCNLTTAQPIKRKHIELTAQALSKLTASP